MTGQVLDGHAYVVTRGLSPTILGIYDLAARSVKNVPLPTGLGGWANTLVGTDLYVGTYVPADLYRYDTVSGELSLVASLEDQYVWDLTTAPDGMVFAGGYPSGHVYQLAPETGAVTDLGAAIDGEQYVRCIASDQTTVYVGVGAHAHLMAIDRASGSRRDILPSELASDAFVYDLGLSEDAIVAGMYPSGRLAIISKSDPSRYTIVHPDGANAVDMVAVSGGTAYFTIRTAGSLWSCDLASGTLAMLGAPAPGEEHRGLVVQDGTVYGFADSGLFWTYQLSDGTTQTADLEALGLRVSPEQVMSSSIEPGLRLYSGGHGGTQVHDLRTGASSRFRIPGEPKAMTTVQGINYMALYPSGDIAAYDPNRQQASILATLGDSQIRPRGIAYDPSTDLLLVGSQPDYGLIGGAFATYSIRSGRLDVYRDIVPHQSISSVTAHAGRAYLGSEIYGGSGAVPIATDAVLAEFDLTRRQLLWQVVPLKGARSIRHVVWLGGRIFGTTDQGMLFVVDIRNRQVVHTAQLSNGEMAMAVLDGALYVAGLQQLLRIDPGTYAAQVVIDGLDADSSSFPQLVSDPSSCCLYTLTGRDILRVSPT